MIRKLWPFLILAFLGLISLLLGIPPADRPAHASPIAGTGRLSGTVKASKPFKAARIYARNLDKHVLYMVYTAGGEYHAVNLFPGKYEVSAEKAGFTGDVKTVLIAAGAHAIADLSLRPAAPDPNEVPRIPYDTLYPPGAGRDLVEKTCIACHGAGFLPLHQWSEAQ